MRSGKQCDSCYRKRLRTESDERLSKLRASARLYYYRHREDRAVKERAKNLFRGVNGLYASAKRNARERGKADVTTLADIRAMFPDKWHGFDATTCAYCGILVVAGANASIDHVDPSGEHSPDNLVVACVSCNSGKHDASAESYRARLAADQGLQDHIRARNEARLSAYLMQRYCIPLSDIEAIVERVEASIA